MVVIRTSLNWLKFRVLQKKRARFFAIVDTKCKIRWVVYSNGAGQYGIFCQEDGTVTGYTKNEVTEYDNEYFAVYRDKIIAMEFEGTLAPGKVFTKELMYRSLGIKQ